MEAGFYYANLGRFSSYLSFPTNSSVVADLLLRERILAAPVTIPEYFRLQEAGCVPLSDFGLFLNPYVVNQIDTTTPHGAQAALVHAPYVLLTRAPLEEFETMSIGVDHDLLGPGCTAYLLAKILLSFYWELDHEICEELSLEDDAWLVPGGPYITSRMKNFFGFPYAYDLSWEFYRWQKTPFVFLRWIAAPNLQGDLEEEIVRSLRQSLELSLRNLSQFANHEAQLKGLDRNEVLTYLQGFGFRLGLWNKSCESTLKQLVSDRKSVV